MENKQSWSQMTLTRVTGLALVLGRTDAYEVSSLHGAEPTVQAGVGLTGVGIYDTEQTGTSV